MDAMISCAFHQSFNKRSTEKSCPSQGGQLYFTTPPALTGIRSHRFANADRSGIDEEVTKAAEA